MSQIKSFHVKNKQMCQTKPKFLPPHQSTQAEVHLSASKHALTGNSKSIACKMSSWQKSTLYMLVKLQQVLILYMHRCFLCSSRKYHPV